jgi:putative ABC transport system ATP-binding protein
VLVLDGIAKTFLARTPNSVRALDGVSLTLAKGDFVSVIGSNGAGKSTLLKTISGMVVPDSGCITLDGLDITREPVHRRAALIGRVSQDPMESTCASMSIAENLAMAARRERARGLGRAITPSRRAEYQRRLRAIGLGLEDRLDARLGMLSGGQRQAVALLMATMAHPCLLLLDEHLANLDPRTAKMVMALTTTLVEESNLTTFMVTHDMGEAIRSGNRLLMIHAGQIIFAAEGAAKASLTVADVIDRFHAASGAALTSDRTLLLP